MNRVTLLGRVAGEPTSRLFEHQEDQGVVNFTLYTKRRLRNAEGEFVSVTDWHKITKIGRGVVDYLPPLLQRGVRVFVEGSIRYDTYRDREGVEKTAATIYAGNLSLLVETLTILDKLQVLTPDKPRESATSEETQEEREAKE